MAAIRAFFSRLLFAAYVVGFTSLPLALLLGTTGAIAGAIAAGVFLLALRYHGSRRIAKLLKVDLLTVARGPYWPGLVQEYCRRLGIRVPQLGVVQTDSVNVGTFGFRPEKGWVIVTQGALDRLNRAELSSLIARELTLWKQGEAASLTWLALFLNTLDTWVEPRRDHVRARQRRSQPVRVFLRQVLLYPLTLVPCTLLRSHTRESHLDTDTVALCGSRRSLAEALRKVDAYSERTVLRVPTSLHHLFLKAPSSPDPMANLFFSSSTLAERIRYLEELPLSPFNLGRGSLTQTPAEQG
jgi:heat shock protein HtpX